MSHIIDDTVAVILAAGKGVRMKSELPKVLHKLQGKSLILHVLESLHRAGITECISVIGYKGEMVQEEVEGLSSVVWQHEQLGTGHAVMQAEESLGSYRGNVIVACGDVPLISSETFSNMAQLMTGKVKAVVLTMTVEDPTGYGRVVRQQDGSFERIVEHKDAHEGERSINEVNTGTYIFNGELLFKGLKGVNRDNAQGEYYLPDVLTLILDEGFKVEAVKLKNAIEGTGVNSKDDLAVLERSLNS
jgi:UDP-N-acetylglucosamine pyrophosphorylase